LLSVDYEGLTGKSLYDAVLMIRGPKGTNVTIEVVHEGSITPTMITIERQPITISSVDWETFDSSIGVIRISTFSGNTAQQLQTALNSLENQGTKALVLDLRNNGGGLLSAAVDVASKFLSEGFILTSKDSSGVETKYPATGDTTASAIPLVILVNGNTASAAEVVAGALQDQNRAILVGTKTFGKGSVTWMVPLTNGAGLNYTIARWFTPRGTLIEGNGLTPDLIMGADGPNYRHESIKELSRLIPSVCQAFTKAQDHLGANSHLGNSLGLLCEPPSLSVEEIETDVQLETAIGLLRKQL
jgi:carboxyl-terminal processing protease